MPSLDPGESAHVVLNVAGLSGDDALPGGGHFVRLEVDPDDLVDESREYNNQTMGALILLSSEVDLRADVTDLVLLYDASAPTTDPVTAMLTVPNTGVADAKDAQVSYHRIKSSGDVLIGTFPPRDISGDLSASFPLQFVPEDVDPGDAAGLWSINAEIAPDPEETNLTNNVVIAPMPVATATGNLEGAAALPDGTPLGGVHVVLEDTSYETTSSADFLPDAVDSSANFAIADVPSGGYTVTLSKAGYQTESHQMFVALGETRSMRVYLEEEVDPDLQGSIEAPGYAKPGDVVEVDIILRNARGRTAVFTPPMVIGLYFNEERVGEVTVEGTLDPGVEKEIRFPGGPFQIEYGKDTTIEVIIDEDDTVVESAEGNNGVVDMVTNPKPEVTITGVSPNPADYGTAITLDGSAEDETGAVLMVEWRSDRDGLVGQDAVVVVDDLSAGIHTLTLRARDERGEWAEASVAGVEVRDALGPEVAILYGLDGLEAPASVALRWAGLDDVTPPQDLAYSCWLEGADSGYGPWAQTVVTVYRDLVVGTYTFRVQGRDAAGNVSQEASYGFEIVEPPQDTGDTGLDDTGLDDTDSPGSDEPEGGCGCGGGGRALLILPLLMLPWARRRR
ncbi:MAG: hypothetical protein JRI25_13185 [Deltaproteobacteria bacterium]|nr:hypothetical protein [Deltaproteobacteria bacterium]